MRKWVILILLIVVVLASGCISTEQSILDIAKTSPKIQQFLDQYHDADIKITFWNNQSVSDIIDEIKLLCGEQMVVKDYYKIEINSTNISLTGWIDLPNQVVDCVVSQTIKTPKEVTPIHMNLSINETLSPNQTANITLDISAPQDVSNITASILLPEGFELISGNTSWTGNLTANETVKIRAEVKINKTGNFTIESLVKNMTVNSSVEVKPSGEIYMNNSDFFEGRTRSFEACYPTHCFVPNPRKGDNATSYFKSLNLTEEYVYFLMQFENIGGNYEKDQAEILSRDNISIFEYHGDYTFYAKAPRTVLETKSYDFVRWVGIVEEPSTKIHDSKLKGMYSKNCTGSISLGIVFYEVPDNKQLDSIRTVSEITYHSSPYDVIDLQVNISRLGELAKLNFVESIWVNYPSVKDDWLPAPDPFENINCTT